jgi:hypothetical protein
MGEVIFHGRETVHQVEEGGSCELLRLRLDAVAHDGCQRWHRVRVGLRLLGTYREGGYRVGVFRSCRGCAALRSAQSYAGPFHQMATQSVAISIYQADAMSDPANDRALVHRAPELRAHAAARLLLCIGAPRSNGFAT